MLEQHVTVDLGLWWQAGLDRLAGGKTVGEVLE
jgi:hypothetical protein